MLLLSGVDLSYPCGHCFTSFFRGTSPVFSSVLLLLDSPEQLSSICRACSYFVAFHVSWLSLRLSPHTVSRKKSTLVPQSILRTLDPGPPLAIACPCARHRFTTPSAMRSSPFGLLMVTCTASANVTSTKLQTKQQTQSMQL